MCIYDITSLRVNSWKKYVSLILNWEYPSCRNLRVTLVDCVSNMTAHAQKPDFVFRRNGRVHLNRQGRQFSRLLAAEFCSSAVVMLDTPRSEVVWRVLATYSIRQFPLHFPSRVPPCAITFHLDTTANSATSTDETKFIFLICEGKYFYG